MNPVCVKIQGSVTIDDCAADVLDYMLSYNVTKTIREQFGKRFSDDQIEKAVEGIRRDIRRIIIAKEAAVKAVVAELSGKATT